MLLRSGAEAFGVSHPAVATLVAVLVVVGCAAQPGKGSDLLPAAGPAGGPVSVPQKDAGGYLEADDLKLYYEVRGQGPAVVLIHDGLIHREAWDGQWEPLSKGHRLVRYDRRGY